MRTILVLITILLFGCVDIHGQQHFLLHLGGGITSHYDTHTKNIGAFCVGVGYEYEFDQHWSVSPSILYFSKGWKEKTAVVPALDNEGQPVFDEHGNQLFGKKGTKCHANYIQVPIPFNYYIRLNSPHYISLSFGPYAALGIGGKTRIYGDTERKEAERVYYEQQTFGSGRARRFDTGLTLAVGYEYDRHINLGVNANIGLLNVTPYGGKNKTFYLSFMYRF